LWRQKKWCRGIFLSNFFHFSLLIPVLPLLHIRYRHWICAVILIRHRIITLPVFSLKIKSNLCPDT
jgi:hypothetical protein